MCENIYRGGRGGGVEPSVSVRGLENWGVHDMRSKSETREPVWKVCHRVCVCVVEKADTGRERHVLEIQWNSEITKTSGHIQLIVVFVFFLIDGNVYTFLSILLGSNDGLKLIQKNNNEKKTFTDIFFYKY